MKLTGEEARNIVYEDVDESIWESITEEKIEDHSRWNIHKSRIFKHMPSNKFYEFYWQIGATESQDERAYEYDEFYEPTEVEPVEVKVIKWQKVKK